MAGPLTKHTFDGIGTASATMALAVLAGNPKTAFLATGTSGRILKYLLTKLFSALASLGLVLMNVGAAKIETILDASEFDGSFESAEKVIKAIHDTGRKTLTPEEIKAIDDPVIKSLRKFAGFGRKR